MPVFDYDGKQIVYVHIPKTGGTSVEGFIDDLEDVKSMFFSSTVLDGMQVTPQHLPLRTIKSAMGCFYSPDYIFTIVRNPYRRAESEFKYRMDLGLFKNIPFKERFFNIWLLYTLILEMIKPGRLDNHIRPQSYFVTNDVLIYKLEDGIESAMKGVMRALNLESVSRDTVNSKKVSTRRNIKWSRASIRLMACYYKKDFLNLGYDSSQIKVESSWLEESLLTVLFILFVTISYLKRRFVKFFMNFKSYIDRAG